MNHIYGMNTLMIIDSLLLFRKKIKEFVLMYHFLEEGWWGRGKKKGNVESSWVNLELNFSFEFDTSW